MMLFLRDFDTDSFTRTEYKEKKSVSVELPEFALFVYKYHTIRFKGLLLQSYQCIEMNAYSYQYHFLLMCYSDCRNFTA